MCVCVGSPKSETKKAVEDLLISQGSVIGVYNNEILGTVKEVTIDNNNIKAIEQVSEENQYVSSSKLVYFGENSSKALRFNFKLKSNEEKNIGTQFNDRSRVCRQKVGRLVPNQVTKGNISKPTNHLTPLCWVSGYISLT